MVARTWARLQGAENEHILITPQAQRSHTRVATRWPDEQPNLNPTRPRAQQPNPSYGRPNQLPQTLRTSVITPINELGLKLPTLAKEVGVTGMGQDHSGRGRGSASRYAYAGSDHTHTASATDSR